MINLCVLFFYRLIVVGTVYLLLGFLYQRYIAGAKGLEQIPNYDFWKDFGSLQAVSFLKALLIYYNCATINLLGICQQVVEMSITFTNRPIYRTLLTWMFMT